MTPDPIRLTATFKNINNASSCSSQTSNALWRKGKFIRRFGGALSSTELLFGLILVSMKQSSKHGTFCCRKRAFAHCKSEFWTAKIKIKPSCHACLLCWGSSDYTSQVLSSHSGTRFDKLPVRFVWLNLEIFGPQIALGIRVIQGFILWSSKKTLKMLHKLSRVVNESSDVVVICSERARCVFHVFRISAYISSCFYSIVALILKHMIQCDLAHLYWTG